MEPVLGDYGMYLLNTGPISKTVVHISALYPKLSQNILEVEALSFHMPQPSLHHLYIYMHTDSIYQGAHSTLLQGTHSKLSRHKDTTVADDSSVSAATAK